MIVKVLSGVSYFLQAALWLCDIVCILKVRIGIISPTVCVMICCFERRSKKKKKTDSIVVKMSFFCCGDIKLLSINNCRHWGGCCPDHICCRSVVNVLMKDTWTCGQVGTESPTLQLTDPARSKSEDKFQLHFAEAPTLHVGEFDGMNHQKWPPVHSSCSGYDL